MNTAKMISIKERADRAYGILVAACCDKTQPPLIQAIFLEARNHVSAVVMELDRALERRLKNK